MRFPLALLLLILLPVQLSAQSTDARSLAMKSRSIQTNGMLILGFWGLSNLGSSGVRSLATSGEAKAFHQMNMGWGLVNLGLAGAGLLGSRKGIDETPPLPQAMKAQHKLEKIFLFNAGLDLAYMAGGMWMRSEGIRRTDASAPRLRGFGRSLVLQGGFLLAFDSVMYLLNRRIGKGLEGLLERTYPAVGGEGLGLGLRF